MNKKQLQERWSEQETKRVASALRSRGEITESVSPFGRVGERIDLRGFRMPPPYTINSAVVKDVDFSGAEFSPVGSPLFLERCHLTNVVFDHAKLEGLNDDGNQYDNCRFVGTSLVGATLGLGGSQYFSCIFEKCSFARGSGVRAEFYKCRFVRCKLKGFDFEASAFEECVFEGKLTDVWFRGGYPYEGDERKYGKPRKNGMKNVSFAGAELELVGFSNDCDLSSVILPQLGEYRKYDDWASRLLRLKNEADHWDVSDRSEGLGFVDMMMPHAPTQDWMIVNVDDLRNHIAPHASERIIESLDKQI